MTGSFQKRPGLVRLVLAHVPMAACIWMLITRPGFLTPGVVAAVLVWQSYVSMRLYLSSYKRDRKTVKALENILVCVENGQWEELKTFEEGRLAGLQEALYEQLMQTRHHENQVRGQREYMKEFISHISHQMKTPLAALSMYVELMEDESMLPEARADFLQRSAQQLDRLQWLIQTLLQIAKLEADSLLLDRKPTTMEYIIEDAVEDLDIIAKEKDIDINWQDGCSETYIDLDRKWMAQALQNILKNAVEHTPEGGSVRIWTTQNRFTLSLYIEDNGQGMDEEQIAKVFEPFYSRKMDDVSVGLGLALAKAIVVKHGGQIFVRSTKGEGTRFELVFNKK